MSFSSFGGGGGSCSRSTSCSTSIENGVRVTRKQTTVTQADGTTEVTTEEERTDLGTGQTEHRTITNQGQTPRTGSGTVMATSSGVGFGEGGGFGGFGFRGFGF